ncbi:MAG: antitoxin [Candidatus Rokubacteria bacterium]|nr:antitoxin [Candidatus Rokubacteria bacterium]
MSKRLQVLVDDAELREIQRAARAQRMTVAEWVRQTLRAARRREPTGDTGKKVAVVRAAVRHAFPSGDVEQILSEIERGYADGPRR